MTAAPGFAGVRRVTSAVTPALRAGSRRIVDRYPRNTGGKYPQSLPSPGGSHQQSRQPRQGRVCGGPGHDHVIVWRSTLITGVPPGCRGLCPG
jgi:hypothetical protein